MPRLLMLVLYIDPDEQKGMLDSLPPRDARKCVCWCVSICVSFYLADLLARLRVGPSGPSLNVNTCTGFLGCFAWYVVSLGALFCLGALFRLGCVLVARLSRSHGP